MINSEGIKRKYENLRFMTDFTCYLWASGAWAQSHAHHLPPYALHEHVRIFLRTFKRLLNHLPMPLASDLEHGLEMFRRSDQTRGEGFSLADSNPLTVFTLDIERPQ